MLIGREKFTVRVGEVDRSQRATLQAICHYLQEVASNHAIEIGIASEQMHERGLAWVLCRLQLWLESLPVWHEQVEVQTWAASFDKVYANRDFELFNDLGEAFGRATTRWMVLDLASRRPVRLPDFVMAVSQGKASRMQESAEPVGLGKAKASCSMTVRESDVDFNGHANHVNYVEWALEAIEPDLRRSSRIAGFDICFLAEANPREVILSEAAHEHFGEKIEVLHRLSRVGDQREIARARSVFVKRVER
jgi:medium-chain acyl-[acyl-carrier-protein] hydrolase